MSKPEEKLSIVHRVKAEQTAELVQNLLVKDLMRPREGEEHGKHYTMPIPPWIYSRVNGLGNLESEVIKRITSWKQAKDPDTELRKAIQEIKLILLHNLGCNEVYGEHDDEVM